MRDIPLQRRSAHASQILPRFTLPALASANPPFHIFVAYTPLREKVPGCFVRST